MPRNPPFSLPGLLFLPLLAIALVPGCADRTPPTEVPVNLAPSFNFVNGPSTSGPHVVRYEGTPFGFFLLTFDVKAGLLAFHGIDLPQLAALCNGNPFSLEEIAIQDIHSPEDANRIIELAQGDNVATIVGNLADFDCRTPIPVALGTADLVLTDNDLFTFNNPESVNFNAFGYSAHGLLDDGNGNSVRFTGHSRCVWDGDEGEKFKCDDKIVLTAQ